MTDRTETVVGVPTNLNDVYIEVFKIAAQRFYLDASEKHAKEAVKFMADYPPNKQDKKE